MNKLSKNILHLTLKKRWFDAIAEGKKKIEYREIKPYWGKRLDGRTFDLIHFRNGYQKNSPFMRVECLRIEKKLKYYHIHLGKIFDLRM